MRGNRDLQLAVGAAIVSALLAILLPVPALSLIAAAPLVLFLPGYAIACAAFARRRVDVPRLLVLSFGLSLAVLALLPLLLDALPGGISTAWWAVGLCAVVLGASRAAALGRRKPARHAFRRPRMKVPAPEAALIAVGVLAAVIAMFVAFHPVSAGRAVGYTELWIEPLEQATPAARVGVASREQETARFTIEMRMGGSERPFEARSFRLAPGDERELLVRPPGSGGRPLKVSATLFREGFVEPYRRVAAWVLEAPE
jgi:uncharacterized membrane protein